MVKKKKFTQKNWLEYLNNLNNREISKRSSSGITIWALFGLIGFILFELIDRLPTILMDATNVFLSKLFITNFFNLFLVFGLFIAVFFIPKDKKRKIPAMLEKISYSSGVGVAKFIVIVVLFSNIHIIFKLKYYGLCSLPYYVFATYGFINIIAFLISIIMGKIAKKKHKIDLPYLDDKKYTYRENIVSFPFLLLLLLFSIYQILQNNYILNYLYVFKSVLYLVVFIGAIIFCVVNYIAVRTSDRGLEELERKIILQNLSEDEIAKEFTDIFVGKQVTQWLDEIKEETKEIVTKALKYYNELNKEIDNLKKEEKDLIKKCIKATTILNNFIERGKNLLNTDIERFKRNMEKIDYFLQQGALSYEEELIISEFRLNRKKEGEVIFEAESKWENRVKELEKYVNEIKKLAESKDK